MLLVALLACAPDEEAAETTASIEILSPEDGATVCGTPLVVEMKVEGLELVDPYGNIITDPGTGHVDMTLNG